MHLSRLVSNDFAFKNFCFSRKEFEHFFVVPVFRDLPCKHSHVNGCFVSWKSNDALVNLIYLFLFPIDFVFMMFVTLNRQTTKRINDSWSFVFAVFLPFFSAVRRRRRPMAVSSFSWPASMSPSVVWPRPRAFSVFLFMRRVSFVFPIVRPPFEWPWARGSSAVTWHF